MPEKKNRKRGRKRKFLLVTKSYWLIEDKLIPKYADLIESYSEKLREEWKVKEVDIVVKQESDAPVSQPVHERIESEADSPAVSQPVHERIPAIPFDVSICEVLFSQVLVTQSSVMKCKIDFGSREKGL